MPRGEGPCPHYEQGALHPRRISNKHLELNRILQFPFARSVGEARKLFIGAHAAICVPATEKCLSESRLRTHAGERG